MKLIGEMQQILEQRKIDLAVMFFLIATQFDDTYGFSVIGE